MCDCEGKCFGACEKQAQGRANHPAAGIKEHDKIVSRTTGRSVEISLGPNVVRPGTQTANCHKCGCPTHLVSAEFGWAHDNPNDFQRCRMQGIPAPEPEGYDKAVTW